MSNKDCYLFLNNKRISDIRELRENFDTAVLVGYYLGGGLGRWLKDIGEETILSRINEINPNYDISEQLEFAFGVRPDKKAPKIMEILKPSPLSERKEPQKKPFIPDLRAINGSYSSYFMASSFLNSSFINSFSSSFNAFFNTSYKGIFTGSFNTSFITSFNTSFLLSGSFGGLWGSFLSGSFSGSLTGGYLNSEGSFVFKLGNAEITETEYKKTMINLSSCPLNQYGYGINLI